MMEPHIDVITLAVGDLDRSLAFYRDGLGLETTGVVATEFVDEETNAAGTIVIFRLRGGLVLTSTRATNSPRTPTSPSDHRRRASSASDNSSRTEPRLMRCSPKPNEPAPLSRGYPTTAPGGSTPATSATPTDTSGRSSGTRQPNTQSGDRRRHTVLAEAISGK